MATIKAQTGAQWIEMPVLFSQAASSSTHVEVSANTPSLQNFTEGVQRAHALGYKVFFVPLMQVREPGGWSGTIAFTTASQEQAWFDSYWQTIRPYVVAAANEHVEQMAIAAELQTLQQIAPGTFWNQLIARVRSVFKQTPTYNMNWSSLDKPMLAWLENPDITYIGVSTYIPLLDTATRVDPKDMPLLWQEKIKIKLDTLAILPELTFRAASGRLQRMACCPDAPYDRIRYNLLLLRRKKVGLDVSHYPGYGPWHR